MHDLANPLEGHRAAGFELADAIELIGPGVFVRQEVAGETARLAQPLCFAEMCVGLAELCFARLQTGIWSVPKNGQGPGDIRESLDQLLFVGGRALGLAPVDGE